MTDDEREQPTDHTPEPAAEETDASDPERDRIRRLAHLAGIALLVVIVLPFLLYAVPHLIGAEYSYVVLSGSMQPVLGPGDVTFVDAVDAEAVQTGDVINFKRAEDTRTTTHRVIEVVERDGEVAFRTQGDNNEDPDQGVVTADELRGRLLTVGGTAVAIPLVGYVIQFTSTSLGFALLFIVPVTLLVLNEVWGVIREAKPDEAGEGTATDGQSADSNSAATPADTSAVDGARHESGDDAGSVTFSPNELRLGAGILVAFLAFSAWTAVGEPGPLRIGVTGAVAVALLLVGGLYTLGSTSEQPAGGRSAADAAAVIVENEPLPAPETADSRERVPSLDALLAVAESTASQVSRDPGTGICHLRDGTTRYVYEPRPTSPGDADDADLDSIDRGGETAEGPVADEQPATTPAQLREPDRGETPTEADDD
jgi:signal peptidase